MPQDILLVNGKRRRKNPRGIAWSGCVARPRRRKGSKRTRMVRYAAGRSPAAFAWSSLIGRAAARRLLKRCRRAKRGGCKSAMGRSLRKRCRGGRRSGGRTKCFTARGKRVCFRVRK